MNSESELLERPTTNDEYVRRRAAEIVLPDVMRWLRPCEWSEADVTRELMKIASEDVDGYYMAKQLERATGWFVDASLVEILDGGWVADAIAELTWQWVRCLNVQPAMKIGDPVIAEVFAHRDEVGTVFRIYEREAKYGVEYPGQLNGSCYVVPFEKCRAALVGVTA